MKRFQADADFNQKVVIGLRRREPTLHFRTAAEGGVIGLSDSDVLNLAAEANLIVVSHDRQTMTRLFANYIQARASPGLVIVDQDLGIGAAIEELLLIWAATEHVEWRNTIGYVPI